MKTYNDLWNYNREKYILSPYIVELMQGKVPFMVFHDNYQILEGDEVDEWNIAHGLTDPTPRMLGHHITDKHGREGYVLNNSNGLLTLTIPDEVIRHGYEAVKANAKQNDIILLTPHEWKVEKLRRSVAADICNEDIPYGKVLEIFDKWKVFDNWEDDDFYRRPVDTLALLEAIEQEMGL